MSPKDELGRLVLVVFLPPMKIVLEGKAMACVNDIKSTNVRRLVLYDMLQIALARQGVVILHNET